MMEASTALVENSSEVISFVSATGKVLYTSPAVAELCGYLPEEVVGRNAVHMIHPEDREPFRVAIGKALEHGCAPLQIEVRVRRKNGDWRWVENTISNLLDEPLLGAIIVNSRETRRAAKEQERQEADDLLLTNTRIEDFAYALVDDLREPLRTISLFTEVPASGAGLSEKGQSRAAIKHSVLRMSALLERLHSFALSGLAGPAQPVALSSVVAEVVRRLGNAIAESGARVTVDLLPTVQGSEKHLRMVLQNLLDNAIRYHSEAPVEINVTAEWVGKEWAIKVKDNGVGIAREHHDRIFALFTPLHGRGTPGAGIGLAICKTIVEAMGGMMWVESQSGSGSTFWFTVAPAEGIDIGSLARYNARYFGESRADSAGPLLSWVTKKDPTSDTSGVTPRMKKDAGLN
jgi:PAS domain S-box-containing protein